MSGLLSNHGPVSNVIDHQYDAGYLRGYRWVLSRSHFGVASSRQFLSRGSGSREAAKSRSGKDEIRGALRVSAASRAAILGSHARSLSGAGSFDAKLSRNAERQTTFCVEPDRLNVRFSCAVLLLHLIAFRGRRGTKSQSHLWGVQAGACGRCRAGREESPLSEMPRHDRRPSSPQADNDKTDCTPTTSAQADSGKPIGTSKATGSETADSEATGGEVRFADHRLPQMQQENGGQVARPAVRDSVSAMQHTAAPAGKASAGNASVSKAPGFHPASCIAGNASRSATTDVRPARAASGRAHAASAHAASSRAVTAGPGFVAAARRECTGTVIRNDWSRSPRGSVRHGSVRDASSRFKSGRCRACRPWADPVTSGGNGARRVPRSSIGSPGKVCYESWRSSKRVSSLGGRAQAVVRHHRGQLGLLDGVCAASRNADRSRGPDSDGNVARRSAVPAAAAHH